MALLKFLKSYMLGLLSPEMKALLKSQTLRVTDSDQFE